MRIAISSRACCSPPSPPPPRPHQERYTEPTEPIVVTGIRIQDYRDRLAACLARSCPPNEDIDATTALAEACSLEGEYREARTVLRASLGRNRDEAARYPEPVSDLYRASARVPATRLRQRGAALDLADPERAAGRPAGRRIIAISPPGWKSPNRSSPSANISRPSASSASFRAGARRRPRRDRRDRPSCAASGSASSRPRPTTGRCGA